MGKRHGGLAAGRPKDNTRERKSRCLIVTNGEVTETEYFKFLQGELGSAVFTVRSFREDPGTLAEKAKTIAGIERASVANKIEGFTRVFVVTDVDDFTSEQFQQAQRVCKGGDMDLLISNPCFEVWLIDHVMPCPESCSTTKEAKRKASELGLVGGNRSKYINFDTISNKLTMACDNASRHNTED